MLSDIVIAGQVVEVRLVDAPMEQEDSAEIEKKVYRTKVFDVVSEEQLEIMMPLEKEKLVLLPVDGELDLCFYTPKGLYQCYAKVKDRYKSNNVYILVMELTTNLRKHQRREYYRLGCALQMDSRELETQELEEMGEKEHFIVPGLPLKHSVIVDISGGGLRFIADYRYHVGCMIYCNYNLSLKGEVKQYHLVGKVLECVELENKPGVYEHRVQYVNPDKGVREEIIKYIFQEERKQRQKATGN